MPIRDVSRRKFLSTAALGSAAIAMAPVSASADAHAAAAEPDWYYTQKEWDSADFEKLVHARRTIKQIFDMTDANGDWLVAHVHNSLTGLERGFGIPKNKILAVVTLRGFATAMNLDDYAWKKYQVGAGFNIKDPKTKKPLERNIFYASAMSPDGKYDPDPDNPKSIENDSSLQSLQRRGVQILCCHVAIEAIAQSAVRRLKLKQSQEEVAQDLLAHLVPGLMVVPSMVSAISILETQGRFTYLRV